MSITYQISISDLVQAVGVIIGIPVALWTMIKLFKKDTERQKEIISLVNIAQSQKEINSTLETQIRELKNQTKEFQHQTRILSQSNTLLEKQISIQNEVLISDKNHKKQIIALEEKKRRLNIQPEIISMDSGSGSADEYNFKFKNVGKDGIYKGIGNLEGDFSSNIMCHLQNGTRLKQGAEFNLLFKHKRRIPHPQMTGAVNFYFSDNEGNEYYQVIERKNSVNYVSSVKEKETK